MKHLRHALIQGRSKVFFEGPRPEELTVHFQDPQQDQDSLQARGIVNASLTATLMNHLSKVGIPTHFIKNTSHREHLVHAVDAFPFFFQIHNAASLHMQELLDVSPQTPFALPIVESGMKKEPKTSTSWIHEDHALALGWCSASEWVEMQTLIARINDYLRGHCDALNLDLLYYRLEFGRPVDSAQGEVMLCDEISLETLCVKDQRTGYIHRPYFENTKQDTYWDQHLCQRFGSTPPSESSPYRSTLSLVKS